MTALILLVLNLGASLLQRKLRGRVEFTNSVWLAGVIDLVYYHGKSVTEVAEIVGVAEATVKTRMFYARKKLAELLEAA
jgi:predicted DNA-binding protein (UPF0251 family)